MGRREKGRIISRDNLGEGDAGWEGKERRKRRREVRSNKMTVRSEERSWEREGREERGRMCWDTE